MGKLYFKYGTVGASRTSVEALMCKYSYEEIGQKVLFFKTRKAVRDSNKKIQSKPEKSSEALILEDWFQDKSQNEIMLEAAAVDCIIVDEVQFARAQYVNMLANIVDTVGTPVICYGLKTDHNKLLFESSKRLFEIADSISEIKTICKCGRKAIFSIKADDSDINGKYIACCRKCAKELE